MGTWLDDHPLTPAAREELDALTRELTALQARYVATADEGERDRLAEREDEIEYRMHQLVTGKP